MSAGQTFYGTNGGYSFFTGTDATRSFATGDFEKDLNDDLADFSPSQCVAIEGWLDFYMKSEKYPFVGYLEDSKYVLPLKERNLNMDINAAGEYSELKILGGESYEAFSSCVQRGKDDIEMEKTRSGGVTCNKEMNIKLGTGTIWCSDKNTNSNINEQTNDDYHVPRRMVITQASDNSVSEKCVCVVLSQATTRSDLNVYDNCKPNARTCSITA